MKFTLNIESDGAELTDAEQFGPAGGTVADMLRDVAASLEIDGNRSTAGHLRDGNGNTVGTWRLDV